MDNQNPGNPLENQHSKDNELIPVFNYDLITVSDLVDEGKMLLDKVKEAENRFPIDVLPKLFRDYVEGCYNALNFPIDYTGTAILSAVATAIGKSSKIKVKDNWYNFPCLYIGILGDAGANKSHPQGMPFKFFYSADKASIDRYTEEMNEFNNWLSMSKKEKAGMPQLKKPRLIKTVLHNCTPEILFQRLTDNPDGCVFISDELATFLEGINNYSKGDQTAVYLSIFNNQPTTVDRVGKDIPLMLQEPFLNIIGSLQPRVLQKLFPPSKINNGFLQRFLFAYSENAEKQAINDNELPENIIADYTHWLKSFKEDQSTYVDEKLGLSMSRIYNWSKDAKAFFYQWHKNYAALVNENKGSLDGEIISKFDIHLPRLALVLQIMDNYRTDQISLRAVEGAAKLCNYFIKNSMKVLAILESSDPACLLPENKSTFFDSLPNDFSTCDANGIGMPLGFNKKAVQRFVGDKNLFTKAGHGKYYKNKKTN